MALNAGSSPSSLMVEDNNSESDPLRINIEMLRDHMGLPRRSDGSPPRFTPGVTALFFIETAPPSSRGSRCKLPTCTKGPINPGQYRIALNPSMDYGNFMRGREGTADFYHLRCFEMIADFSQISYLKRVNPVTRSTFNLRGIKASSMMDGNYLLDGGAERLVLQWKVERGRQIDERDDAPIHDQPPLAQDFADLLKRAGEPGFQAQKPEGMEFSEFRNLTTILAPNESDGPEDDEVWNLFDEFLYTREPGSLDNRHDLSDMLETWQSYSMLATEDESMLNAAGLEAKAKLRPKDIRALQRLSRIPMLDFQSIFFHGTTR
ncbi:hypothetical protein EDB81DRAFT_808769 [Dactylonectria macrodidyma]|uniref:Uncharacterized protein n=1 Tax=Dactylonectria macrodidyma TaxID=307937 RepID=A0A9P9E388_9HYPO|nr:hypothetical protein EDB81DRAFT_808769 [Dactylonectria macrodidyma]